MTIYLASPYSHPDPVIKKTRFLIAQEATANLIRVGHFVWSPIVHCYEMAQRHTMPDDAAFWKAYNFDFIRRSEGVFVLDIEGWRESKGVIMEIDMANYIGLPVQMANADGYVFPFKG